MGGDLNDVTAGEAAAAAVARAAAEDGLCPYGCESGWLPVPKTTGFRFSTFREERDYYERGGVFERGTAVFPDGEEFPLSVPCFRCNEEQLLGEDEPETGMSLAALTELLTSEGARPDEFWPDAWAMDGHVFRLSEIGPDTWRLEPLASPFSP